MASISNLIECQSSPANTCQHAIVNIFSPSIDVYAIVLSRLALDS